ncbi:MAG: UDP-N-acetylglucosamine 2-epimerase (non-hydrolyzing) [Clostridiaceae bacterium]|nr:UDP-N-acetylglucosamine 2-epimerase (non-hydrolyzing) [Clostridiaceae bacterium]
MNKIKVMSVFGTRPEAIKMAPLVKELAAYEEIEPIVCVTGQHREMLDQVLNAFNITPDFDLDIMEKNQTLSSVTSKVLMGLKKVFEVNRPDIVLVHGDTTTSFAAALAAFYDQIKVGHVEAGLRSFDKTSPYPEEMNRVLTGRLADIHFAPTALNARNLFNEGVKNHVYITGNTVIDALKTTVSKDYFFECPQLNNIDYNGKKVVLMTAHRRENYGRPMENIMQAVSEIAQRRDDAVFVYPVHLSPYVQDTAKKYLDGIHNVKLIPPIGVFDMHNLMSRVYMVMTDSGGLQEEAPALGKPVLVLRRETERPEAVASGTVEIVGTESADIIEKALSLFDNQEHYFRMKRAVNPYGDGFACARIAENLLYYFGMRENPAREFVAN